MRITQALTSLLLGTMMMGCSSTIPTPPRMVSVGNYQATLAIVDDSLTNRISLIDPNFRKTGVLTQGIVGVQNLGGQTLDLEYLVEWTDRDGFPVESVAQWHAFRLSPRETKKFTSVGKDPEILGMKFKVRSQG